MKKFIFTAIAMVMFSVNSFGNAIANNDEMTNSKEYEEVVFSL